VEDLFDVMNQAVEHPLYVDFDFSPQCEPIEPFVHPDVAEDRLHDFEALAVDGAALRRIDLLLHSIQEVSRAVSIKYMDLPCHRVRIPEALGAQCAVATSPLCAVVCDRTMSSDFEVPITYV